jgi:hypothetical protein
MTEIFHPEVGQVAEWIVEDIQNLNFLSAGIHLKSHYCLLSTNLTWLPSVIEVFSGARKDDPQAATTYCRILWYQNSNIELLDDALSVCIDLQSWHHASWVLKLIENISGCEYKIANTLLHFVPRIVFPTSYLGYDKFLLSLSLMRPPAPSVIPEIAFLRTLGSLLLGKTDNKDALSLAVRDPVSFGLCKAAIALMGWNRRSALDEIDQLRNALRKRHCVSDFAFSLQSLGHFRDSILAEKLLYLTPRPELVVPSDLASLGLLSRNEPILESLQSLPFDNAYVIREQKAIYVKSEKSACTSLLYMVWRLNGGPVIDWSDSDARPLELLHRASDYLPLLSSFPLDEQVGLLTNPEWFIFSFVRDPISRFLSSFQDKFLGSSIGAGSYPFCRSIRFLSGELWPSSEEINKPIDICQFAKAILSIPGSDLEYHFRPQFFRLRADVLVYDLLGRISSAADWSALADRIGWEGEVPRLSPHSSNPMISKLLLRRLVEFDLDHLLLEYYACDLSLAKSPGHCH